MLIRSAAAFALTCALSTFCHAQPTAVVLAQQALGGAASKSVKEEMERDFADATSRPLFKHLRTDAGWGPEHPAWKALFPEFKAGMANMNKDLSPDLEANLTAALARSLTEDELTEIVAKQNDGSYEKFLAMLQEIGFSNSMTIQLMGIAANPSLYSQAEKDSLKDQLMRFKGRESELTAAMPRVETALKAFQTPAFTKYRKVLTEGMSAAITRTQTDPQARLRVLAFLGEWRQKALQQ
jgi:hypothetical protein